MARSNCSLQVAAHIVPWLVAIYCVIRYLPRVVLAGTHVIVVAVALFHRAPSVAGTPERSCLNIHSADNDEQECGTL